MVIDASIVVDGLIDQTSAGDHARELMGKPGIYVPDLLYSEVSSALRKHEVRLGRSFDPEFGSLLRVPWDRVPFSVFGPLTWPLRHDVSLYDAAYVALALALGVPLATTDRKLASVATRYCEVVIPGE
jgi:predicted nucleic acid-binding protein